MDQDRASVILGPWLEILAAATSGLGWQLRLHKAREGFGHYGDWGGFKTSYYNYLTNNHTVVLLSNRGDRFDDDKFWEKLDQLIEAHSPAKQ